LRRNVNLTILLFNNKIYGLTKGQYSPTSEEGKVTKSTPMGSVDRPFNPVSLALGAEATFVARTMDNDRKHLIEVLKAAASHRGTALVEIYQNCPIFNDGAFDLIKDRSQQEARLVHLEAGQPIQVGPADDRRSLVRGDDGDLTFVPEAEAAGQRVVIHDPSADDPSQAFAISRLTDADMTHVPMGIFRSVQRPTYDDRVRAQVEVASNLGGGPATDADLDALLRGRDTWSVG
ncbi:MAG: thiamine pyrophosphate-dependent enzyme, partial [Nostocoides sp.]